MTIFWIIIALLVAAALTCVLPPLLRTKMPKHITEREAVNIAVYRDQFAELEADLQAGTLSETQYQEGHRELERRLLDDVPPTQNDHPITRSRPNRLAAILIGIAIPATALLLYSQIGKPGAILTMGSETSAPHAEPGQIESMVATLAGRMESNPQDGNGWLMLGRSYMVLNRYSEASLAYAKAHALLGDQPDIVTDYAEAQALADGGRFSKKTVDLLTIALKTQPDHIKALSLAGMAAYQGNDFQTATKHWNHVMQLIPPESPDGQTIQTYLARAQAQFEEDLPASPSPATPNPGVRVRVELDPRIADKAAPNDTVFVFARAVEGPRMPLAIVRKQVKDLPIELTLDDSMAMMPDLKISSFSDILIGARISRLGSATPQSGDLTGPNLQIKIGNSNSPSLVKIYQVLP